MPVDRQTFRAVPCVCEGGHTSKPLVWSHQPLPACSFCGKPLTPRVDDRQRAHSVIGDEIDRTIADGVCHADGTPRRFTSRQELQRAERASGYRILERGERFKNTSGRSKTAAR